MPTILPEVHPSNGAIVKKYVYVNSQILMQHPGPGNANMFLSLLFAQVFATVTKSVVELYNTDGSQGAARGAGIGAGIYKGAEDAYVGLAPIRTIEPDRKIASAYQKVYQQWKNVLKNELQKENV